MFFEPISHRGPDGMCAPNYSKQVGHALASYDEAKNRGDYENGETPLGKDKPVENEGFRSATDDSNHERNNQHHYADYERRTDGNGQAVMQPTYLGGLFGGQ